MHEQASIGHITHAACLTDMLLLFLVISAQPALRQATDCCLVALPAGESASGAACDTGEQAGSEGMIASFTPLHLHLLCLS
jgi:hypothetical protein